MMEPEKAVKLLRHLVYCVVDVTKRAESGKPFRRAENAETNAVFRVFQELTGHSPTMGELKEIIR